MASFILLFAVLGSFHAAAPEEFEKGKIIQKVVCRDSADQSYALYLPADFRPNVKRPVLYLFDPRANGPVAVEKFRLAAEKYGWILVASNNSRNGPWEPNQKAAWTTFQDSMARLPIDETRIYAGGFSGGARVASLFPMVIRRRVAGIIGIGAGISTGIKPQDIWASSFFGIVGLADFNYPEMKRLDADLDGTRIPHRILFYEAPHQWPDVETCDRAVGWMEIMAMREGTRAKDDSLIDEILGRERQNASGLLASGKIFWAARQYGAVSQLFAGLRDTDGSAAEANRLERSREYAEFLRKEKSRDERDASLRREFVRAYAWVEQSPDDKMGLAEILRDLRLGLLKKEAKNAGTVEDRSFAFRILFDFSLTMGQKGTEEYDQRDWPRAAAFWELAVEACPDGDPRLKHLYFNLASVAALRGDEKAALRHLETAVDKGFSDIQALENDKDLDGLRKTSRFKALVERAKKIQG